MLALLTLLLLVAIAPADLASYFMPFVVFGITYAANKWLPTVPGIYIYLLAIALSGAGTFVVQLIDPSQTWLVQFLGNLLSIIFSQLLIQLKKYGADVREIKMDKELEAKLGVPPK